MQVFGLNNKQSQLVAGIAVFSVTLAVVAFLIIYFFNRTMKISNKGLDIIKQYEGLKLQAYQCTAGVWTIGYGHTKGVKQGDSINEEQAEQYLIRDVQVAEDAINAENLNINQNQFDALVSFVFNCGVAAFKSSTLLRKIKADANDPAIADEFAKWRNAGGSAVAGLVRRRGSESNLYFAYCS